MNLLGNRRRVPAVSQMQASGNGDALQILSASHTGACRSQGTWRPTEGYTSTGTCRPMRIRTLTGASHPHGPTDPRGATASSTGNTGLGPPHREPFLRSPGHLRLKKGHLQAASSTVPPPPHRAKVPLSLKGEGAPRPHRHKAPALSLGKRSAQSSHAPSVGSSKPSK